MEIVSSSRRLDKRFMARCEYIYAEVALKMWFSEFSRFTMNIEITNNYCQN